LNLFKKTNIINNWDIWKSFFISFIYFYQIRIETENLCDLDHNLIDLLTNLLSENPENRYNIIQIKVINMKEFIICRIIDGLL